ncbi:MAG: hypothetical protein IMF11_20260 [Proteobacteria bacterium]|nr:hypothetical protein [Pseudomonadota bacterium]
MEKRVLVIPNWGQMTEQIDGMPAEDALKKYSPGNLLAEFEAEVGSVFGHYTEDPKGSQVELKIVAIPDGLEGEQIEKGKEYHILILEVKK